jgi:hypothetical protein
VNLLNDKLKGILFKTIFTSEKGKKEIVGIII